MRPSDPEFLRRLLYRWFVTYNPLYLVSAMLVLVGLNLLSASVSAQHGLVGPLGVAALAESYALTLLGAAALLRRRGLTRPAVQLALLVVLYQGDLTLHTETCAIFGRDGFPLSVAWLGVFGLKLAALAHVFDVRLSRRTWATALTGATGLALLPFLPRLAATRGFGAGTLLLALGGLLPRTFAEIATSGAALDAFGEKVLRRVIVATFATWGAMLCMHVVFWAGTGPFDPAPILFAAAALLAARSRSEVHVWIAVVSGVAFLGAHRPTVAAFAAAALVLRAHARVRRLGPAATATDEPYRVETGAAPRLVRVLERVGAAERLRLFTGALFAAHLAAWTSPLGSSVFPQHLLWLDVGLVVGTILLAVRGGRLVVVGTTGLLAHGAVTAHLVPLPVSARDWGIVALGAGFAVLLGGVGGTAWFGRRPVAALGAADG